MRLLLILFAACIIQPGSEAFAFTTSPALSAGGRLHRVALSSSRGSSGRRTTAGLLSLSALSGGDAPLRLTRGDLLRGIIAAPLVSMALSDASAAPLPGEEMRALIKADIPAWLNLTIEAKWGDTKYDLDLLLSSPDRNCVGAFVGGELVSTAVSSFLPATTTEAKAAGGVEERAWLSFVVTRSDMRRKGLARRTCSAALAWLDEKHPGTPMGLFGEKAKAAPLYRELGFSDVGKTFHWVTQVDPMSLLRSDMSIQKGADGKYEVPNKVDRITLGATTAIEMKGKDLIDALVKADLENFGADRSDALRAWVEKYADLCWVVRDVDFNKVQAIFDKYASPQTSGGLPLVTFDGFVKLAKDTATEGEVTRAQWETFCVRSGADPSVGLPLECLLILYHLPGNDASVDYAKITNTPPPPPSDGLKGYIMGREMRGGGYWLGPVIAADQEVATTLILAAVRGGSTRHLAAMRKGNAKFELMVIEEGTGEYVKTAKTKAAVFAALGFKADLSSTFMVRNGGIKSFYKGSFDKVFATSSYEFA